MAMTSTWEIFPANLDVTANFYVSVLGFQILRDERSSEFPYLALRRDEVVIGASPRSTPMNLADRRPPVGVELGLEVDDLDATYAAVQDAGWPIEVDVVDRPWGIRDFRMLDPDGYYLCVKEHESSDR